MRLDLFRSRAYELLMSPTGNRMAPLRWGKSALLYANDLAGRPLASQQELDERREYELADTLLQQDEVGERVTEQREPAPVVVYHLDKHASRIHKLTELLDEAGLEYEVLNLEEDLATREAVERDSEHPLPVVVIGGTVVGGRVHVSNLLASGKLRELVHGAA